MMQLTSGSSNCPFVFADAKLRAEVSERLLQFWQFFRQHAGPVAGAALSVRDLLSWAGFINTAAPSIGALPAYAHGAHLTLLDGIGLGAGLPSEVRCRSLLFLLPAAGCAGQLRDGLQSTLPAATGSMSPLKGCSLICAVPAWVARPSR